MIKLVVSKLLSTALVVFGVACLVFLLIHLVPGDPIDMMLGENAQMADRQALREALGLDQSLGQQFITYFSNLLQGDLGTSLHSRVPVVELIAERLPATVELAIISLLVSSDIFIISSLASSSNDRSSGPETVSL